MTAWMNCRGVVPVGGKKLPSNWAWSRLGDLGAWSGGGTPSKANQAFWEDGSIPWVSPKDMKFGRIRSSENSITEEAVAQSSAKLIPANSILMVTRSGILAHSFPVAVNEPEVTVNQDLKTLTPVGDISPDFLTWYLRSQNYRILKECAKHGTTVASIDTHRLKNFSIPLAPLNEQHRIVEKIETLFAQVDKGEEALREVQKLLKRYRQSILKAAVTGELTRDWREANQHKLEPASDLLARILEARQENWQVRRKYKEPLSPDLVGLPQLPAEWAWVGPEQLSKPEPNSMCIGPFGSNLKVSDYRESGVPLIFVRHIRSQDFNGKDSKFVSEEKARELSSHRVCPGDLLITKMGDPPGDVAIYPNDAPSAVLTADCIRLSIADSEVSLSYLELAISSPLVQSQIKRISKGVAQQKVSLANFKRIGLPIPPSAEQREISSCATQAIAGIDKLERSCELELARSEALRQSILKSAFTGQLVPQDPNDEPASELLARIRVSQGRSSERPKRQG